MVIKTLSRRLAFVARIARVLPPCISGRFAVMAYPRSLAKQENAAFTVRSSLADLTFRYPRAEPHATYFAARGFWGWQNVVIANTICQKGDTIIDVGSNIGTEMLIFAKKVAPTGKVVSFEPLPDNFNVLKDIVSLNNLNDVVSLNQAAVSESSGTIRFQPPTGPWNTGDGRLVKNGEKASDTIEVRTVALDELYEAGVFTSPRLLVTDSEGAELFVLRGARKIIEKFHPYIILEMSPVLLKNHGFSSIDIYDFLESCGYTMWSITGWGLSRAKRIQPEVENWLCIPGNTTAEAMTVVRKINLSIILAAFLPVIKGLNPAVVS